MPSTPNTPSTSFGAYTSSSSSRSHLRQEARRPLSRFARGPADIEEAQSSTQAWASDQESNDVEGSPPHPRLATAFDLTDEDMQEICKRSTSPTNSDISVALLTAPKLKWPNKMGWCFITGIEPARDGELVVERLHQIPRGPSGLFYNAGRMSLALYQTGLLNAAYTRVPSGGSSPSGDSDAEFEFADRFDRYQDAITSLGDAAGMVRAMKVKVLRLDQNLCLMLKDLHHRYDSLKFVVVPRSVDLSSIMTSVLTQLRSFGASSIQDWRINHQWSSYHCFGEGGSPTRFVIFAAQSLRQFDLLRYKACALPRTFSLKGQAYRNYLDTMPGSPPGSVCLGERESRGYPDAWFIIIRCCYLYDHLLNPLSEDYAHARAEHKYDFVLAIKGCKLLVQLAYAFTRHDDRSLSALLQDATRWIRAEAEARTRLAQQAGDNSLSSNSSSDLSSAADDAPPGRSVPSTARSSHAPVASSSAPRRPSRGCQEQEEADDDGLEKQQKVEAFKACIEFEEASREKRIKQPRPSEETKAACERSYALLREEARRKASDHGIPASLPVPITADTLPLEFWMAVDEMQKAEERAKAQAEHAERMQRYDAEAKRRNQRSLAM